MPVADAAYALLQGLPEPLSPQALQRMRRPVGARDCLQFVHYTSPYFERIRYELMRYCSGEINGLSVLISGQRGAGKTTLTKLVIQKVMQEEQGAHSAAAFASRSHGHRSRSGDVVGRQPRFRPEARA